MKGQKVTNVRTTVDDKKVNWTKIRRIPFTKGSPDMYFVKYNYGKEFQCIKLTMIHRDVVLTEMSQMKCQDLMLWSQRDKVLLMLSELISNCYQRDIGLALAFWKFVNI